LFEFSGPDAVRFLNGQITQDVRLVMRDAVSLPSCVTDAKGRLQFRIRITRAGGDGLWVEGPAGSADALEARLTRYLIADDVTVSSIGGAWSLVHFTGAVSAPADGVIARSSARFGVAGTDWWIPAGLEPCLPEAARPLAGDALEAFRIAHGVAAWGRELTAGLLPPEAGLDTTDISYQKGCYIGQEVISRIKSAGRLNKRLVRLRVPDAAAQAGALLTDAEGREAGHLTSVSPLVASGMRAALGYLKRGTQRVFLTAPDGPPHEVLVD
jgi:folate-binding protein YgfZ